MCYMKTICKHLGILSCVFLGLVTSASGVWANNFTTRGSSVLKSNGKNVVITAQQSDLKKVTRIKKEIRFLA